MSVRSTEHSTSHPNGQADGALPARERCLLCGAHGENGPRVIWTQTENINWGLTMFSGDRPGSLDFLECRTCKLIFKDPIAFPVVAQERRFYLHHENDLGDPRYMDYLGRLLQPLFQRVSDGSEGLDFGCGPTKGIEYVCSKQGISCTSYDPFFHPLASALDRQYDFVTCSEVAEHLHDPAREFELMVRLLRPKGKLAVMTQSPPQDLSQWHYHWDPTHVVFYSNVTFEWIAAKYDMRLDVFEKGVRILELKS